MKRICYYALILAIALAFQAAPAFAYSSNSINGVLLHWRTGSVIKYTFNSSFAPNAAPGSVNSNDLVRGAIANAILTLSAALPQQNGAPVITWQESGTTSVNQTTCDGVNLISFTDTNSADAALLPTGVIAVAAVTFAPGDGTISCGSQQQTVSTGEIIDADILFNPGSQFHFTTSVADGASFDIQSIATHEIGHTIGLHHSGILSAVMSPYGDTGAFPNRGLQTDDMASITVIYGSFSSTISGRVTDSTGASVKSAHVVAADSQTGIVTATALTDQNGNYKIGGVTAGRSYTVFAEPLDGPAAISNMPAAYAGGNANFLTTFLTNPVNAIAGNLAGVNIALTAGAAAMNLNTLGILQGNSGLVGAAPITVNRGSASGDTKITMLMNGSNLSGTPRFSSSKITVGAVTVNQGFQVVPITVPASTSLGPMNIYFGTSSFTGGIVVTPSTVLPTAACPGSGCAVVEAASNNTTGSAPFYAPGSIISIYGSDFTSATSNTFAGFPPAPVPGSLPNELAGVSVKVGNILAPIIAVDVNPQFHQINAIIPFEASGTVPVQVTTGSQSQSAAVNITLGSSAPRLFSINNQGTLQGAIRIVNTALPTFAAPLNSVPGDRARPAVRGSEYVTIYCTGLGAVTNQPATGLAASASPLSVTVVKPTVTIGGVAANINDQFFFAGLTPTFVGLYQINVLVPANAPIGDAVPVVVSMGSNNSNTVNMAVGQ